jgi:hypothetical protein
MHSAHYPDLKLLLETLRPASLLLIDPNPDSLPSGYLAAYPDCQVTHITHIKDDILSQLQSLERVDLGVVANTLEYLDRKTAGRVFARLRDINTRRFVVLVPIGNAWEGHCSHWETTDLLGYGMTLMARYRVDDKPLHLYHYAIETYKTTPDWLNSKHWAHPEHWKP